MGETEQRLLRYVELKRIKASYDEVSGITRDTVLGENRSKIKSDMNELLIMNHYGCFMDAAAKVEGFEFDADKLLFSEPKKKEYEALKSLEVTK